MEDLLLYMNRSIETLNVKAWINDLREKSLSIDFPNFVSQYSGLFAGADPDIIQGEEQKGEEQQRQESKRSDSVAEDGKEGRDGLQDVEVLNKKVREIGGTSWLSVVMCM